MTVPQIEGLIDHIIDNELTDDKEMLSKIYVDLGVTGGNIFKLKFEAKTGKTVPDPYPSWSPNDSEPKVEKKSFFGNIFKKLSLSLS